MLAPARASNGPDAMPVLGLKRVQKMQSPRTFLEIDSVTSLLSGLGTDCDKCDGQACRSSDLRNRPSSLLLRGDTALGISGRTSSLERPASTIAARKEPN